MNILYLINIGIDKNLVVDYCKVNNIMQDKKKCSLLFIQNSIDGK